MTKKMLEKALEALTKEYQKDNTISVTLDANSPQLTANIRTYLTLPEKSRFVDQVATGCFAEGQFIPEYLPVMKELFFYQLFTDLPLPTLAAAKDGEAKNEENPLQIDIQKVHDRCQALNLVEKACLASPKVKVLFEELCLCADEQVSFLKKQLLSQERQMLQKVTEQLTEMSTQMNEIATNASGMLEGLDGEQISRITELVETVR